MHKIIHTTLYTLFAVSLALNALQIAGYQVLPPSHKVERTAEQETILDIFEPATKRGK
jgi:hypothetical protein